MACARGVTMGPEIAKVMVAGSKTWATAKDGASAGSASPMSSTRPSRSRTAELSTRWSADAMAPARAVLPVAGSKTSAVVVVVADEHAASRQ